MTDTQSLNDTPLPPEGCICASFWTVRQAHKPTCPLYESLDDTAYEDKPFFEQKAELDEILKEINAPQTPSLNDKLDGVLLPPFLYGIQLDFLPSEEVLHRVAGFKHTKGYKEAKQALVAFIEEAQAVAYKKGYIDKGINDLTKEEL